MTERSEKQARVRRVLDAHGLDEIVLRDPANLAWYLCGARVHVVPMTDAAILEVTVTRDGDAVRTSAIEAPRLRAEELGDDAPPLTVLPWTEPLSTPGPPGRGSDRPQGQETDVADDLREARSALTAPELDRYRALCRDTAAATGDALRAAAPGDTEFGLAGRAAAALLDRAVEPLVLLVAGGARLPLHRHPLPTAAPLATRAMLVVCGRRAGLVSAVTRMRAFTPLTATEAERYAALLEVEAAALGATRPGARIGAVVAAVAAAYPAHGFAHDEWRAHHQGGPLGYATRDYLAGPETAATAHAHQAFAWNPSGGGFKVEDTVVTTADGDVEILSHDPAWPATTVAGRQRPAVLS